MSQDLFAAFGDPPPEAPISRSSHEPQHKSTHTSHRASAGDQDDIHGFSNMGQADSTRLNAEDDEGDDDWGDFEDASADPAAIEDLPSKNGARMSRQAPNAPQSSAEKSEAPPQEDSKIGKHPFAGHMDFLFEPGDDEYDAGEDDLANLAKDPEAAMAFSKRLIAEQEAKAKSVADRRTAPRNDVQGSRSTGSFQPTKLLEKQHRKLSKPSPQPVSFPKESAAPVPTNPPPARNKLRKKSGYAPAKDPDVLFDADNLSEHDDDDEFGDFENGSQAVGAVVEPPTPVVEQGPSISASMDLLGLDDNLKPVVQIGRSRSDSLRKANEILGPTKKSGHSRTSSLIDDSPWDDFQPQASTNKASTAGAAAIVPEDDVWDDFEAAEPVAKAPPVVKPQDAMLSTPSMPSRTTPQTTLPPTNIPPPAILLSVFPSILSSAQDALFLPISRLDQLQRQQLLAHPATQQFLRSYLETSIVLARIIAGRKSRWKRDQILSQSMRIGQAGAGGKSGMKLTGVDKGEAKKEEQEAQEALRLWRTQAGKLRGAVTAVSSANAIKLPPIPEISEQMPVRTLKVIEGGFTAPNACALCGLKREERVAKVDVDVDDSFGEWWVQGVDMHLACRNWWDEHNKKLKSR